MTIEASLPAMQLRHLRGGPPLTRAELAAWVAGDLNPGALLTHHPDPQVRGGARVLTHAANLASRLGPPEAWQRPRDLDSEADHWKPEWDAPVQASLEMLEDQPGSESGDPPHDPPGSWPGLAAWALRVQLTRRLLLTLPRTREGMLALPRALEPLGALRGEISRHIWYEDTLISLGASSTVATLLQALCSQNPDPTWRAPALTRLPPHAQAALQLLTPLGAPQAAVRPPLSLNHLRALPQVKETLATHKSTWLKVPLASLPPGTLRRGLRELWTANPQAWEGQAHQSGPALNAALMRLHVPPVERGSAGEALILLTCLTQLSSLDGFSGCTEPERVRDLASLAGTLARCDHLPPAAAQVWPERWSEVLRRVQRHLDGLG